MNLLTLRSSVRLVVFVTLGILGTFASAAENPGGQAWLLSTRRPPLSSPIGSPVPIDYWALGPDSTWLPSDDAAFHATDASKMPTCIFIHGNRADWQDAIDACRAGRPSPVGEWISDHPGDRRMRLIG
jgi:hypothetical protein